MSRLPLVALLLAACADRLLPGTQPEPAPAPSEIAGTIFLIGDAGAPAPRGEPVLAELSRRLASAPESSVVLFLGDNVYPRGVPDSGARGRAEAERRLRAQIEAAAVGSTRTIFVPGNHDWDKSGAQGLAAIRRQDTLITALSGGRATLLPRSGCAGPEVRDVHGFRLVLLDTEWWLFSHHRPDAESGCAPGTQDEVLAGLASAIAAADTVPVVVAGHHPLATGGEHGGHFFFGDHVFPLRAVHQALWIPLPLVGSVYPLVRSTGVSDEDFAGGRYVRLRQALDSVFASHPPLLYASGHEHALQLIDRGRPPLLAVSGAGILGHEGPVAAIPGSRLALSEAGFMRLDRLEDGRVRLAVIVVDGKGAGREVYAEWLSLSQGR
jgi:hypothetical protein